MSEKTRVQDRTDREDGNITRAEAEAVLEAERRERAERAASAVRAVLRQFNCSMSAYVVLRQGSVEPRIEITAND